MKDDYRIELDLPNGHVAALGDAPTVVIILRACLAALEQGIEAPAPVASTRVRTRQTRETSGDTPYTSRNPHSQLQQTLQNWLLATLPASEGEARDLVNLTKAAPVKASLASVSDALAHLIRAKKVTRVRVGMRYHYYLAGVAPQPPTNSFVATIVAGEGVTKGSV